MAARPQPEPQGIGPGSAAAAAAVVVARILFGGTLGAGGRGLNVGATEVGENIGKAATGYSGLDDSSSGRLRPRHRFTATQRIWAPGRSGS